MHDPVHNQYTMIDQWLIDNDQQCMVGMRIVVVDSDSNQWGNYNIPTIPCYWYMYQVNMLSMQPDQDYY
jgi:hypothetical protein